MMFSLSKDDKILSGLFITSLLLVSVFWFFRDAPELFDGGDEVYDYALTIILGYIVSYIFYLINLLLPKIKSTKDAYRYVGDCLAYISFNTLMLADCFNRDHEKIEVKLLTQRGIRQAFQKGMELNCDEIQKNVNKYNILLIELVYEKIRTTSPIVENDLTDFINITLSHSINFDVMFKKFVHREQIIESQNRSCDCKRFSQNNAIGFIKSRFKKRLDLLRKHEHELDNFDLVIYLGDGEKKLRSNPAFH